MNAVGLKQFRVDSKSDALLSYCIYDPQCREAILIDPHFDAIDEYAEFVSTHRLKPILIIETQIHWSHPSASRNLASRYSCLIGGIDRELRDQEIISLGALRFKVLFTPGVSRDALVLVGERALFSGNTLWIGSCGPGGSPDSSAAEHFQSLKRLMSLADCLVFPAYDANELIFSTLSCEKKKNTAFHRLSSLEEFVNWSRERAIVPGEEFKAIYEGNVKDTVSDQRFLRLESVFRSAGKISEEESGISIGAINSEKYSLKLKEHASTSAFLDVREKDEFETAHIPGTQNVPWVEVGFHLSELRAKERIYISCLSGKRSNRVSRNLAYLGFNDVVNVSGGFNAWQNAGLPTEKGAR